MPGIKLFFISFLIITFFNLPASRIDDHFSTAIAYYLLDDIGTARIHFNIFFNNRPNPQLSSGFVSLLKGDNWGATRKFKRILDVNYRSIQANLGIALSTADMKTTTTIENLQRAIKLKPDFAPGYLCLGTEFMKRKNYPLAEKYLKNAVFYAKLVEYKIILAKLYILINQPQMAIKLIEREIEKYPNNFYLNLLTAKALFQSNDLENIEKYINMAIKINATDNEARLIMARYLARRKDFREAKSILSQLTFDKYHEDYAKTYAYVSLKLKDKNAFRYLYQVFSKNKYDKEINKLLALYFLDKGENNNVQHWINRAILSGNEIEELKQLFSLEYEFPEYLSLPFFNIKKIKWISDEVIFIVANLKSGDSEKIFFVDSKNMKIIKSFKYRGELDQIFFSQTMGKCLFSTKAAGNDNIFLYAVEMAAKQTRLTQLYFKPLSLTSILIGFDHSETQVFITEGTITSIAFESPFAKINIYGKKSPVYPVFPFRVYRYHFGFRKFSRVSDIKKIAKIPIRELQQYFLVNMAFHMNKDIKDLIQKGQKMDLTSNEVVRIHFSQDLSAFIIYLSDLTNAFQARVYKTSEPMTRKFDATMFLDKGKYAEVQILNFRPEKNEVLFLTKDKKRSLISFNYDSFLYTTLVKDLLDFCCINDNNTIWAITERSKMMFYSTTDFHAISLSPYRVKKITSRRDLQKFIKTQNSREFFVSTYNGELLKIDIENNFVFVGPSPDGTIYDFSDNLDKAALFINGRLLIIDWINKKNEVE